MLSHKMEVCLLFLGLLLANARSDNNQHPLSVPGPSGCGREGDPGANEAAPAGAVLQAVRDAVRLEVQQALRLALQQGTATRVNEAVRLQVEGVLHLQEQSTAALREVLRLVEQPPSPLEQLQRKISGLEASCNRFRSLSTPQAPPATPSSSPATAPSAHDDQTAEKTRVQERIKEVAARMEKAQAQPSRLGEALCVAAWNGTLEEVRRLLDDGADVNYTSSDEGQSPLVAAAAAASDASPGVLALLLSRGADANAVNVHGVSALHFASALGESAFDVCLLLGAGAAVDARDKHGYTALHLAAYYEREAAVRALLAGGASKNLKAWDDDWDDQTPFDVAKGDAVRNLLRP